MLTDKQQILETITAVSRLITLAFKPIGTKIAIRNHNLVLDDPNTNNYYGSSIIKGLTKYINNSHEDKNIMQGLNRYMNKDSREDIFILNHVICNFIEWYIIPSKYDENYQEIYKGLINMAKYLCVSLKVLQQTYKLGTVVGTLQYYIIVLTAVINDTFYPQMLFNTMMTNRESFLDETMITGIDVDDNLEFSTIFDVDKFKNFWTKDELKKLCEQFDDCFVMNDEPDIIVFKDRYDKTNNLNELNNQENNEDKGDDLFNETSAIDQKKHESNNTSPKKEYLERFPVARKQTNIIVQGHLIAIDRILNIMDKRFTAMINQSVKGMN